MIKAIVISSDREAVNAVTQILRDFCPNVSLSDSADSMQAGVSAITLNQPDILILDTKLTDGNGFELLKHFDTFAFRIIFISIHIEYALKAFKFNAVDFLLKPVDPEELAQAVNKACDMITNDEKLRFELLAGNIRNMNKKETIILKTFDHIHIVKQEDILRVEADRNYSTFFTTDGRKILVSK